VFAERRPARIERCLIAIAALSEEQRPIQDGLLHALATHPTVTPKQPIRLPAQPAALQQLLDTQSGASKKVLLHLDQCLIWPNKPGARLPQPVAPLSESDAIRFQSGNQLFLGLCAACHQPHGRGQEGLAPPLVDSEWVLGSPERLSRILLHGVRGRLKVGGALFQLDMPAMSVLSDQQMADVLTYIRREWNHGADPVSADFVQAIRKKESSRQDAWTEPELLAIP
jgi:mono/diheme cytochrome c family protein